MNIINEEYKYITTKLFGSRLDQLPFFDIKNYTLGIDTSIKIKLLHKEFSEINYYQYYRLFYNNNFKIFQNLILPKSLDDLICIDFYNKSLIDINEKLSLLEIKNESDIKEICYKGLYLEYLFIELVFKINDEYGFNKNENCLFIFAVKDYVNNYYIPQQIVDYVNKNEKYTKDIKLFKLNKDKNNLHFNSKLSNKIKNILENDKFILI